MGKPFLLVIWFGDFTRIIFLLILVFFFFIFVWGSREYLFADHGLVIQILSGILLLPKGIDHF